MKELLVKKQMLSKTGDKKFTVGDVYKEAAAMLKEEMRTLKNNKLSAVEAAKLEQFAKELSKSVLKEMDVI